MIDPSWGPLLFDTSAESWFARVNEPAAARWWCEYLRRHQVHISSITVFERMRGYALLWRTAEQARRSTIEASRIAYVKAARRIWSVDPAIAAIAGEIAALIPDPPTPPKRSHCFAQSRAERLARWRFDGIIAATALVTGMTLMHNNPSDFETIRSSIETDPERFSHVGSLNLVRHAGHWLKISDPDIEELNTFLDGDNHHPAGLRTTFSRSGFMEGCFRL